MKFQADREVLSDAISFVVRMLSPKPQLPQLSGVMITAENNQVVLSVFDYEGDDGNSITKQTRRCFSSCGHSRPHCSGCPFPSPHQTSNQRTGVDSRRGLAMLSRD